MGSSALALAGVCLVERCEGLIASNPVFFDRALLDSITEQRATVRVVTPGYEDPRLRREHADGDFG